VDELVKEQASEALASMGLSISDAVRVLLTRVAAEKALPFEVRVPNALTAATLAASDRDEDVIESKDKEELFRTLGL